MDDTTRFRAVEGMRIAVRSVVAGAREGIREINVFQGGAGFKGVFL